MIICVVRMNSSLVSCIPSNSDFFHISGIMNVTPGLIGNPMVAQQSPLLFQPQQQLPNLYQPQQPLPMNSQWINNNNINNNNLYNSYQLPLRMSQYYNVFPEIPSTKTSWTFPNGCVTSSIVR